jgi:hypothetical protein
MSIDTLNLPAPLVLGVTGHRDLRPGDLDPLRAKVREIFAELRALYPSTPFILISSLAEGADRLVAGIALEPTNQTRLIVPLPMPQAVYETDFDSAGSVAEFRDLLTRAAYTFQIPLPAGVSEDAIAQPGPARNRQYELQGYYLAEQSQILIALWDGVDSGKPGGTSEVVKCQLHGVPRPSDSDLEQPEQFPVYRIATPRASNPVPDKTPFTLEHIYPPAFSGDLAAAQHYYQRAFGNADEFNRLILQGGDKLAAEAARSQEDCVGGDIEETELSPNEASMLHRYGFADALAIRHHNKLARTQRVLHILVFLAYTAFVLSTELENYRYHFLAASIVFLGGAFWAYLHARFAKLDNKTEDYRALAEACRVRFFWQLAGITASVSDRYLGEQRTELDWIRRALFGWEIDLQDGWPGAWDNHHERIEFAKQHWVDSQRRYFEKAGHRSHTSATVFERIVQVCVFIAIGLALLECLGGLIPGARSWTNVAILIELTLAAGAIQHHYSERRAHHEHRKQYGRMLSVFQTAARLLRRDLNATDLAASRATLQTLGERALEESGSWVLLHRARPLELPHP